MAKFITNQNIQIKLELASLGDRTLAFFIDALIIGVYWIIGILLVMQMGIDESLVWVAIIPGMFYTLLFETLGNGQTPGKRARNIKVVKLNGGTPRFVNYLLRWLIRPVDILLYGAVAIVSIIVTKNAQRLGDLAAGTTVVKVQHSYTLDDVKTIKTDNHEIQFPQVKRLNDRQIELIRRTLHMRRDGLNAEGVTELSDRIKDLLSIQTELPDVKFLYTIISDYEHLTQG